MNSVYNSPSIFITATNFCPPNYGMPSDNGRWCNPPHPHFDLAMPVFLKITEYQARIVRLLSRVQVVWLLPFVLQLGRSHL